MRMKILHVASFSGNIGDNASHKGLYHLLNKFFKNYTVKQLEMRNFYQNYQGPSKKHFDEDFVSYANDFDLVIIGGGGFLDYWVPNSASGTTIDIQPKLIHKLKCPTLITSVGCAPHKTIPDGNIDKFRHFLDAALENSKILIAVRNDGSVDSIRRDIGSQYLEHIPEVADHGFFFKIKERIITYTPNKYIAINISEDQLAMESLHRGNIDSHVFYDEISKTCKYICENLGLSVVFVPHIYTDLNAISSILSRLSDHLIREKISVAPCIQGRRSVDHIFGIYKHSKMVIATRLHANICSLAMNIPVLGVAVLDRVKYVYDSLNLSSKCVIPSENFSQELNDELNFHNNQNLIAYNFDQLSLKKNETILVYNNFIEKEFS
ncbi:polysaccharide pyruvyl transferase family protein [Thalassospira australica]|uniref:polysaccharide pyruvyl transferase family protein n=1 Tax=Thalassospira australica TaxID=1528106 RepID=UPI0038509E8E